MVCARKDRWWAQYLHTTWGIPLAPMKKKRNSEMRCSRRGMQRDQNHLADIEASLFSPSDGQYCTIVGVRWWMPSSFLGRSGHGWWAWLETRPWYIRKRIYWSFLIGHPRSNVYNQTARASSQWWHTSRGNQTFCNLVAMATSLHRQHRADQRWPLFGASKDVISTQDHRHTSTVRRHRASLWAMDPSQPPVE